MASKLIPLDEAARQLGVTPDQLNDMRQRQEIYGYRDGAGWKFKSEDLEKLAQQRSGASESAELDVQPGDLEHSSEDMVLLSEVEMGESAAQSSTVIGKPGSQQSPEDSDIKLADEIPTAGPKKTFDSSSSDIKLADSGDLLAAEHSGSDLSLGMGSNVLSEAAPPHAEQGAGSDLTLDSSLTMAADDDFAGSVAKEIAQAKAGAGDSTLNLARPEEKVLSEGGAGSDITLSPGDSGISLLDPADSGISLEEAPDLAGSAAGSFDVGLSDSGSSDSGSSGSDSYESSFDSSYDMGSDSGRALTQSADFDSDAVMELRTDDEFLLTPLEEVADEESQDSGSQVIALESDADLDASSPTVMGADSAGMAGLLDDTSGLLEPLSPLGFGETTDLSSMVQPAYAGVPQGQFTGLSVTFLAMCVSLLAVSGLMMFDVLRNMWSWDSPYQVNSFIMDSILNLLG